MDQKDNSLEKRIMADINAAFNKHDTFSEYGIVLINKPEVNACPVVVENGVLGLHAWCIQKMFTYSYGILHDQWQSKVKTRNLRMTACLTTEEILNNTRLVLLINPECYSAWNERKILITSGNLDLEKELTLNKLVLTKHPKSPETFSHRKWLMSLKIETYEHQMTNSYIHSTMLNTWSTNCSELDNLIKSEIQLCSNAADRYPSNYSAWSHRSWFLQRISGLSCLFSIIHTELEETNHWVYAHVSDHSGYHYRQFLLQILMKKYPNAVNIVELMTHEMDITTDIIESYPCHEAVWNHRRFVIHILLKYPPSEEIVDVFDDSQEIVHKCDFFEQTPGKKLKLQSIGGSEIIMQSFKHSYIAWKRLYISGKIKD